MSIRVGCLFLACCLFVPAWTTFPQAPDSLICERVFAKVRQEHIARSAIGEVVVWVGKEFLGSPYAPHTLEQPGEERLVINLREFDCVTFAENVLALARCIKSQAYTFDAFKAELLMIRYRNGVVNGYPSRLHYFSEWIDNNMSKAVVREVTREVGGENFRKVVGWMTAHRDAYRQLSDDDVFQAVAEIEKRLWLRQLWFVPKSAVAVKQDLIQSGDILAMVSSLKGLDVAHVGIAVKADDGAVRYMHAPNERGVVTITQETLSGYLAKRPTFSGVMVARPVEPELVTDHH